MLHGILFQNFGRDKKMNEESKQAIKTLVGQGLTLEQIAAEINKPEVWVPKDGQACLTGPNDRVTISAGRLTVDGKLACYDYEYDSHFYALEWKPAKDIPSSINRIPHKAGDPCPIDDYTDYYVWYSHGGAIGGRRAILRDWDEELEYAVLS
jgi:hypothetical protein